MTIVVAFSLLTEVVVIADTRISWEENKHPPEDILMKLCTFGDSGHSLILGFSGYVEAAKTIMELVRYKLHHYKQPFIPARFKDRMAKWIKEAAKLHPEVRKKVTFMLCGIEPTRHPQLLKDGQVIGYLPFIEPHIYTFSIEEDGEVHFNKRSATFDIIGTGAKLRNEVHRKVIELQGLGLGTPQLHWIRSIIIADILTFLIKEDEEVSATVGGPLQVIRITPERLETHYGWPTEGDDKNVILKDEGSKVIVSNPSSGKTYKLLTIWDFLP